MSIDTDWNAVATIIGVHGIGQQQYGPHQLVNRWEPALHDGIQFAGGSTAKMPQFDIAFYGDLFLTPGASGEPVKGTSGPPITVDDLEELADLDEEERGDLVEAALELVPEAAADLAGQPKGLRTPRSIQIVAGAIGRRFSAAGAVLFFGDLRQVRKYLHDSKLRSEIDARVASAIGADRKVIIGHSLGSVVAYEHLRRQSPAVPLPLFLTIGSPLGLRMVRRWLTPNAQSDGSASLPRVAQWVNVFDNRDPVACAGRLRRWWPAVRESTVDNQANAHDAEAYLSKAVSGAAVLAALKPVQ